METSRRHSSPSAPSRGKNEFPLQQARIFVGNLEPSVTVEDLKDTFKRHGHVLDVVIRKNFAFVQYNDPQEAQRAIEKENGMSLKNRNMSISLAKARTFKEGPFHEEAKRPRKRTSSGGGGSSSSSSFVPSRWGGRDEGHHHQDYHRDDRSHYPDRHAQSSFSRGEDSTRYGGREEAFVGGRPGQDTEAPFRHQHRMEDRKEQRPFEESRESFQGSNTSLRKPNDVEIVCSDISITDYAESIELRLKNMDFTVDVLYPNSDFPLTKILESITNRGVRFALLLTPMSMDHGSVTLNVLQGIQQEHRNMPLEDALHLLANSNNINNREEPRSSHLQNDRRAFHRNSEQQLPQRHPRDIVEILELLLQSKPLLLNQYDDIINYLVNCREDCLRSENQSQVTASSRHISRSFSSRNQSEGSGGGGQYYNKILDILTNKGEGTSGLNSDSPQSNGPLSSSSLPVGGGVNPSLQKAIDSLIKTGPNLLNSIKKLDVPQREASDATGSGGNNANGGSSSSNVNNVLNSYYSSLFKSDNNRSAGGSRTSGPGNATTSSSSTSTNNMYSTFGGNER